jgi:hypothetical protein
VNKIGNALVVLVGDPVSDNIVCSALEVCNMTNYRKTSNAVDEDWYLGYHPA